MCVLCPCTLYGTACGKDFLLLFTCTYVNNSPPFALMSQSFYKMQTYIAPSSQLVYISRWHTGVNLAIEHTCTCIYAIIQCTCRSIALI